MSVPSHNLYDFIHHITERKFLMFYFFPWGEKDFVNLIDYQKSVGNFKTKNGLSEIYAEKICPDPLIDNSQIRNLQPVLFCHDQEPLEFEFYQDDGIYMKQYYDTVIKNLPYPVHNQNLRSLHHWSIREKWILLHTEKNSSQLEKYESSGRYQGAFWWSHALIARDWYRYAEHDPTLDFDSVNKKIFLIYSRAADGTRSYRKKVIEGLNFISDFCQFGSINQRTITSDSSATYDSEDFVNTEISLVLETLFDDDRIYLSEKSLRPLACGHPFILAAGPKSLEFLKSYGFETFHPWINESYDQECDHKKRLDLILQEMHRISSLKEKDRKIMMDNIQKIAIRNKQNFFSDRFLNHVILELKQNVQTALEKAQDRFNVDFRWETIKWRKKNGLFVRESSHAFTTPLMRHCRVNKGSLEQYQRHQHSLDDKSSTDGNDI
jgi:hypothetical protein